jgi:hypothetical protein
MTRPGMGIDSEEGEYCSSSAATTLQRAQEWLFFIRKALCFYFQALYVKVESKGFLWMYWMLSLVLHKRSNGVSCVLRRVCVVFPKKFQSDAHDRTDSIPCCQGFRILLYVCGMCFQEHASNNLISVMFDIWYLK